MTDRVLMKEAEQGRMLRRRIEAKLKEIRLEIRAFEMEARALRAEIEIQKMKEEGPRGFAERAKAARAAQ